MTIGEDTCYMQHVEGCDREWETKRSFIFIAQPVGGEKQLCFISAPRLSGAR